MERLCVLKQMDFTAWNIALHCLAWAESKLHYDTKNSQRFLMGCHSFFFFLNKKTASVQPQCEELYWTQRTTLRSQPGIQASQHVLFCLSSLLLFFGAECLNFLLLVPASPRSSETGKPAAVQFSFLHWTSYLPYMLPRNRETLVKSRVMQGKAVQTSRRVSQSSPNI